MVNHYSEVPDDDLPGMWERADFEGGMEEVRSAPPPVSMDHLNDNNPCGPTEDEAVCACGCSGYDERCAYYLAVYAFTNNQVRPEHRCCKIPGREGMITQITDEDDGGTPRVVDTAVLRLMAEEVDACNREKGWHDTSRTFGEDIALLHSEVSEMLEAYRDHDFADVTAGPLTNDFGDPLDDQPLPKPQGVGSEAADVLVRLLDTCARHDIDLFAEWRRKMDYNWTRPHRHGGKRL